MSRRENLDADLFVKKEMEKGRSSIRRGASTPASVELNLTSMLDVVFNILAFFVVTFSPPVPERDYQVTLPPPKQQKPAEGDFPGEEAKLFQDVSIVLSASEAGELTGLAIEQKQIPVQGTLGVGGLARELRVTADALRSSSKDSLDTANIVAPTNLKYRHLIAVVDACYQANIKKINFGEAMPAKGTNPSSELKKPSPAVIP